MPTTTGLATSFINFSRPGATGGGATVTDRDGKIKWAGHNLLTHSESFDASAWGKYLTTVTANSTAAPNGTTTADTIVASSSNGTIYQSSVIPVGTSTFSCWFKAGTLTSVKVIFDGGAGTGREAAFTLSGSGTAGAVANSGSGAGTLSGGTSSITPLSDGWYLCTIAGVTTTAAAGLTLLLATSGNVIAWGAHLYRSDMQMQLNPAMPAGMQSYYPTTPRNLVGNTEDFSAASWTKSGLAATPVITNTVVAPNGLQTADKIVEGTTNAIHYLATPTSLMASPSTYTFSVYAKAAERNWLVLYMWDGTSSIDARFNLSTGAVGTVGAGITAGIVSIGDGWYRCWTRRTITGASGANAGYGISNGDNFSAYTGDGTSGIYLWGAQLSDSASLDTYVPQYGAAVTSAAYYAPRLDYDGATLAARGLLVEEARTNVLTRTAEFENAAWTKVSSDAATKTTSPDGTSSANLIYPTSSTTFVGVRQIIAAGGFTSGIYTISVYAKAAGKNVLGIIDFAGGTGVAAYFTLTGSGTATNGLAGYTQTIAPLGNGWYRCTMTSTSSWSNASNLYTWIVVCDAVGSGAVTASGTNGIQIYGAQTELGSFATSYIPTGSATATRAADVASVSTQAFPYSASEGTVVVSVANARGGAVAGASFVTFDDGNAGYDNAREIFFQDQTGNLIAYEASSNSVAVNSAVIYDGPSGGTFTGKVAYGYKASDYDASYNGNAAASLSTSGTPAANISRMGIGTSFPASATGLTGGQLYIRQITYIPRKLTDAELAARSA